MLGAKTVAELIEKLKKLPPDAVIAEKHLDYIDPDDSDFCHIETECIFDPKTNKVLYNHCAVGTPFIDSGDAEEDEYIILPDGTRIDEFNC